MHTIERQAEQLEMAGVPADASSPDLSALASRYAARRDRFELRPPYALLVAGGSQHRPGKRWPAEKYGALAAALSQAGIQPVLIGGAPEEAIAQIISAAAPAIRSLIKQTDFLDILALAAGAKFTVGNDTGPTHLIAAAGTPTLVLFGPESDPALCAPRGRSVEVLRSPDLKTLPIEEVRRAVETLPASG
jgi:ADP-heptose:LPS heptosyltransferase